MAGNQHDAKTMILARRARSSWRRWPADCARRNRERQRDSGGPVFFVGPSGNRIVVAVTAGGSDEREVLTRVDLVADTIDRAIAMGSSSP